MDERCDRCGKLMTPQEYEKGNATVHIGFSGMHDGSVYFCDSWTLLCHDCCEEFMEGWREFKNGAPWKECAR